MKTNLIVTGIFVLGLATAPIVSMANTLDAKAIGTNFNQEQEKQDKDKNKDKVKIEKERLPQAVRDAIKKDDQASKAEIKEAWQMTGEDGKMYYAVKFDHQGKEMSKKYDATGIEKKDKKDKD